MMKRLGYLSILLIALAGSVTWSAYSPNTIITDPAGSNQATVSVGGALKVDASASTQPVSQSGTWTVQPGNTANTTAWLVTGTGGTFPATQSGTWNIENISGTVSLPTGAATAAKQPALGTAGTASSDVITVQGIASMTALKVDGSAVTQPVSAASLPLPTGAATEATLSAASAKLPAALGQTTMSGSMSVTLASDQSTVPVSQAAPTAKTVKQAAVTVGTSAVRLTTDGSAPTAGRVLLRFRPDPTSSANFYYGSSSVTSSSTTRGIQVFPGESVEFSMDAGDYYIISDTAGQTVFVVEQE